jgi:hypothetical protein
MSRLKDRALAARDERRRATTLGQLAAQQVGVFCWCNRCGHNASLAAAQLITRLGPACPVPEVGAHLRCSGCGTKDVATRPDWPSLGQVARHDCNKQNINK